MQRQDVAGGVAILIDRAKPKTTWCCVQVNKAISLEHMPVRLGSIDYCWNGKMKGGIGRLST
jgi:hypothetical protein